MKTPSTRMRSLLSAVASIAALSGFSFNAHASKSCDSLVPLGGAYDYMRSNLTTHAQDYLDEISYVKDFGSTDEAAQAGVSATVPVYGVPTTAGVKYENSRKTDWQKEFLNHRDHQVEQDVNHLIELKLLNPSVVKIIADCIKMTDTGLWISVHVVDACHFSVRAGYSPIAVGEKRIGVLSATDAKCTALPKAPLPPKGFVVDCQRKTSGSVHVTVHNEAVGDAEEDIPGVAEPANPVIRYVDTPSSKVIAISRAQALYNWGPYNCPDCQALYGIYFGVPGKISDMQLEHGPPATIVQCPDGGKCQKIPQLFAQTDGSSCIGSTSCLVWFLERNYNTAHANNVTVKYMETTSRCVASCRTETGTEADEIEAYTTAHKAWESSKSDLCK